MNVAVMKVSADDQQIIDDFILGNDFKLIPVFTTPISLNENSIQNNNYKNVTGENLKPTINIDIDMKNQDVLAKGFMLQVKPNENYEISKSYSGSRTITVSENNLKVDLLNNWNGIGIGVSFDVKKYITSFWKSKSSSVLGIHNGVEYPYSASYNESSYRMRVNISAQSGHNYNVWWW